MTRIVVVGPCASGKSSTVTALRAAGLDAVACAQEHSEVAQLWLRSEPSCLLYLDIGLSAIRQRRDAPSWSKAVYVEQRRRLADARRNATWIVDSASTSVQDIVRLVLDTLATSGTSSASALRDGIS